MLTGDTRVAADTGADGGHRLALQLGTAIAFSRHPGRPAFDDHVGHVFSMAAEKQMTGPDTARVVATVADKHAGRNFAVSQFV